MGSFLETGRRFSAEVIEKIREQIALSDGNEVFFTGNIDAEGLVVKVQAFARGNSHEVPVHADGARRGEVLIHNHPSGNLTPSDADLSVASNCSENAQGFYIINNLCSEVYVVLEPVKPAVTHKLDPDKTAFYLSSQGPLARISPMYEERKGQLELVTQISRVFNENGIGVFEAGTGVGKSFAYLIPSILWAAKNRERVVISTGTINLQQQLTEKDIPQAIKITGEKIKAVLVKGRQNFVCLRRLEDCTREKDLFDEDQEILDKIYSWTEESKTGSRSDLSFNVSESLWSRVNSESDSCFGMRCPFREKCFVLKMRKEAADANLLVVNHHLLFADIESRLAGAGYDDTAVLPPYRRVVFDECHGIEESATSFFSSGFTRFRIIRQLNYLFRLKKGSAAGFIFTIGALTTEEDYSGEIQQEISVIKDAMADLETVTADVMDYSFSLRLHSGTASRASDIINRMHILQAHIARMTGLCRKMIDGISDDDRDTPAVWETKSVLRRFDDIVAVLKNFSEWEEHPDCVFWIEKRRLASSSSSGDGVYFSYIQTPLDIAPMMNSGVFEPMESVVCASATIGTGGNFEYWKKRTGVSFAEEERIYEDKFDSPFPYDKNLLFAVPSDAPFPDNENFQPYIETAVAKLISAAGGRTLVLFTSYDSLRHACDTAKTLLRSSGITFLKQGDDDRSRLLATFKDDNSSVLFATNSFWEGIDVPGDSLSQVIIVKLPFGVPSDPVFAARSELIEKRGGSPFMELSVPDAVIKFRQGFGRLIRRTDDRGCVIVLDRRIIEKRYGSVFLRSIPETKKMYSPTDEIVHSVENFIN